MLSFLNCTRKSIYISIFNYLVIQENSINRLGLHSTHLALGGSFEEQPVTVEQ